MEFTQSISDLAFPYFAVDWVAMVFTFVAIYLLGNQARAGFVVMMGGNSCWVVVGVLSGSVAMVIANAVFFMMNARGWWRWGTSSKDEAHSKGAATASDNGEPNN